MSLALKPKRSLRSILIFWFILFSIVPLAFISFYSINIFEDAIDNELSLRLQDNGREISSIISDYRQTLNDRKDKLQQNSQFIYDLTVGDSVALRALATDLFKGSAISGMTFYDREGFLLSSVFKDEKGEIRNFSPKSDRILINKNYRDHLKDKEDFSLCDYSNKNKISLIYFSKVYSPAGKHLGYVEQIINLDKIFLNRLKNKNRLEIALYRDNGEVFATTSKSMKNIRNNLFIQMISDMKRSFFEVSVNSEDYGFLLYPVEWGASKFYLALGASKLTSNQVLKNLNVAFLTVVGTVIFLVLITVILTSQWIIKPITELLSRLQVFATSDAIIELPITNQTEIGLLTRSFNDISRKIIQARGDLKKKIKELEGANQELKETQTKLVHSAKMVSLGQLVAGVAHELNNPISFIYANMTHLREYSDKLFQFIHEAIKQQASLKSKYSELELDYIEKDLPKLIASCEDGARRTKDIVLGLRNFSRLEEAKLKEVDVRQSIDNTLNLLQGEIKNRVQIHRQYEPVPNILCYASQINQVIMNILTNALQAIEGNGQIWISTTSIKSSYQKDGAVQISFQDTGKGMSPEILEKIFDPFFTTKGVGQGTGLGLSISYGIIQNHGGEIQVRSQVNVGTEFIVTIPIRPPVLA